MFPGDTLAGTARFFILRRRSAPGRQSPCPGVGRRRRACRPCGTCFCGRACPHPAGNRACGNRRGRDGGSHGGAHRPARHRSGGRAHGVSVRPGLRCRRGRGSSGDGSRPCGAVVEVPGTEAVLAERPAVVITARAEGTPPFFSLAVHETVATGPEGTFVLTIPAEGRAGLRGLVTVTGCIGEGAGPEGLVRILPEAGLVEAVAVGTAEVTVGSLVLFVIEAGKGTGTLPGVHAFVAVAVVEVPGTEAVLAESTKRSPRGRKGRSS